MVPPEKVLLNFKGEITSRTKIASSLVFRGGGVPAACASPRLRSRDQRACEDIVSLAFFKAEIRSSDTFASSLVFHRCLVSALK